MPLRTNRLLAFLPLATAGLLINAAWAQAPAQKPAEAPGTIQPAHAAPEPGGGAGVGADSGAGGGAGFLRVVHDRDESLHLQVAVRTYAPKNGEGPQVSLVGVAHIGQKKLYRALQSVLNKYDVVLFESVKPEGTGGAGGSTDQERVESTKSAMRFVGGLVALFHVRNQRYPAGLGELTEFTGTVDPRLKSALATAMVDGWGGAIRYSAADGKYDLISYGSDGKPGAGPGPGPGPGPGAGAAPGAGAGASDGAAADLCAADLGPIAPLQRDHEDGLQSQLAQTLGLEFQLDAIDYDHSSWRCSDMSMDQLQRAFKAAGLDFAPIGGTLAGSSLTGKLASFLLRMVRVADAFLEGALADASKVMLIEMLGDESVTSQALKQMGEGFNHIIVEQRNQVAIDDLEAVIRNEPAVKTVAIFYGAAHMRDMADRLTALGYEPAGEPKWIEAIGVNAGESKLTAKDIRELRLMLRNAIRQQFPAARTPRQNAGSAR